MDFIGARVTSEVNMSGYYQFHYDEALGGSDDDLAYKVTSWNEVPVNPVSTTQNGI
jgi:hypothetical protein